MCSGASRGRVTRESPHPEAPEAAALASATRPGDVSQFGRRLSERLALAALPVVDKVRAVCVVLEKVMVVDSLLDEPTGGYGGVDTAAAASAFAKSGSPSSSQTNRPSTSTRGFGLITWRSRTSPCLDCVDQMAQDVHDVLRLHSSQRPREDHEVERVRLNSIASPAATR